MRSMATQLVRYKKGKLQVEVMTKPGSVLKYRAGKLGFDNVLQSDDIWKNSSKGERAANADLMYGYAVVLSACVLVFTS